MKFEDLEVGMEVLVLWCGSSEDLGNAGVDAGILLSTDRWATSHSRSLLAGVQVRGGSTGIPDRDKIIVHGRVMPDGKYVPVILWNGEHDYVELVKPEVILGPVDEWRPKVDAARRERENEV